MKPEIKPTEWVSPLELIGRREVCSMFGGIHAATLYRHIRNGLVPAPVKIGSLSRWLRFEVEATLGRMAEARR